MNRQLNVNTDNVSNNVVLNTLSFLTPKYHMVDVEEMQ